MCRGAVQPNSNLNTTLWWKKVHANVLKFFAKNTAINCQPFKHCNVNNSESVPFLCTQKIRLWQLVNQHSTNFCKDKYLCIVCQLKYFDGDSKILLPKCIDTFSSFANSSLLYFSCVFSQSSLDNVFVNLMV